MKSHITQRTSDRVFSTSLITDASALAPKLEVRLFVVRRVVHLGMDLRRVDVFSLLDGRVVAVALAVLGQ